MKNSYEIHWYPSSDLLKDEMPGINIIQIVLDTPPKELSIRLKLKGHNDKTVDFILSQREIFFKAVSIGSVDKTIDTSQNSSENIAEQLINAFNLQKYF